MRYQLKHVTRYRYTDAVSVCRNQLHLAPRATPQQAVQTYTLAIDPRPAHRGQRLDYFGNTVDYFSIHKAHRHLEVVGVSTVEVNRLPLAGDLVASPWESIVQTARATGCVAALEAYQLSLPSARVNTGKVFRDFAATCFTPGRDVVAAAQHLAERIHTGFKFDPRATTVNTPPEEFLKLGRGVCQDFAHLAIACLRSYGIPARYVSGYLRTIPPPGKPRLQGADASHAWFAVWCGELGWIEIDPTNNSVVGNDHIVTAWGRDYDDVCPIQGVFIGGGSHTMSVAVDVLPEPDPPAQQQMQAQQ